MPYRLTASDSWPFQLGVAAGSMACAVALTHTFWRFLEHTPFLLGFGSAILSSRVGGRNAGVLALVVGVLGYASFPPPFSDGGFGRLLVGFALISGVGSWLVSRRYEIEADLHASQEQLSAVISHLPIILWALDRNGYVTLSEGSGLAALEVRPRELVGRSVFEMYRDVPEVIANTKRVLAGETFTVVVNLGNVDVETWYSPVRDRHGAVTGAIGVSLDVTERRAAEQVVIRSERRLHTIIEAQPACVKLVSPEALLLEINPAGLAMIGVDNPATVIGRPVIELIHPDDRDRYLEMHRAALSGSPGRREFRVVALNGAERWVDSHAVPFDRSADEGDTRPAVLSVTSDISDRRSLEEQLRQSHKMEAIGLLAGGIAHDFNNLLTAIGGYTEMVLDTFDTGDPRREEMNEVAKATRRAAALTRQLLAVSRRQILQPTVLDVNGMVADVQHLLRRTIPENIDLQLELHPQLDPVRADRGQLEQVVLNLAINAGDAMPHGGRLRLATDTVDIDAAWARRHQPMPAGRYVRLTVGDTGIGMTPETQAHIFEPFFTTKARGRGTGLGLATVYGIVKQSNGFIWVESQVGGGTRFDIYLPVVHEPIELPVAVAPIGRAIGGSQTILLAEDDGAVRRLAGEVLASQGYTLLVARDGDEAMAIARRYPHVIHLLIADVVMPGLSGRELADRLTAERADLRVLYISGYTDNVMARAGFEDGLNLLAKPFLPMDLLRRVAEAL